MLHKRLDERMKDAADRGETAALLFIDLDRFKFINDSMGHSFGDLFLKRVSQRLQSLLAESGELYRHGGAELCIVLARCEEIEAGMAAQRLVEGLSVPIVIDGSEYFTSPSIGISLFPQNGQDQDTLIKLADIAMYHVKKSGGNGYQFYDAALNEENSHKMKVEHELRRAIRLNQFIVHYQPKVNLHTGQIIGVEALMRWQHPESGLVPPLEFIPVAEETGLIVPIGRWVLEKACRQMKAWHDAGFASLSIAVNISPRQLKDKDLIRVVAQVLLETGLDPHYLEIEITESVMENMKESSYMLTELKKLGVRISMDDFGTGYSSLSYLKHLPIDYIKVDKSFVDDITTNPKDEAIIKTIVDMGHHLQLGVVAEGIENEQQLMSLREHRCNVGQGYFFSKPLPPVQVERLFNQTFMKRSEGA
jgi:diguanylate cyclase (GGDEF)-like protein